MLATRLVLQSTPVLLLVACSGVMETAPVTSAPATMPHEEAPQVLEAETVDETTHKNTIKWTTASEVDNFGYDVYRGESEEGPFARLNTEPIPGAGTTDETTDYAYVDDTIDPYAVYWYYVESISMRGQRERFTPIFPSKPKLTRASE